MIRQIGRQGAAATGWSRQEPPAVVVDHVGGVADWRWLRNEARCTARLISLGDTMPMSWPPLTTRARPSAHLFNRGSRSVTGSSGEARANPRERRVADG